jgi:hypothetical protein
MKKRVFILLLTLIGLSAVFGQKNGPFFVKENSLCIKKSEFPMEGWIIMTSSIDPDWWDEVAYIATQGDTVFFDFLQKNEGKDSYLEIYRIRKNKENLLIEEITGFTRISPKLNKFLSEISDRYKESRSEF